MLMLQCFKLLLKQIVKQMMQKILICSILHSNILCLTGVTIIWEIPILYFYRIAIDFL
jgi:hypothetical protein